MYAKKATSHRPFYVRFCTFGKFPFLISIAQNSDLPVSITLEHSLLFRTVPSRVEFAGAILILVGTCFKLKDGF